MAEVGEEGGALEQGFAEAAELQRELVEAVFASGGERRSSVLARAGDTLLSPLVVEGPEPPSPLPQLFAAAFPLAAKHPSRRVVVDGLVSPAEAAQLASAPDRFGDALWDSDEDDYCDASAAARPDWAADALNEQVLRRSCPEPREREFFIDNLLVRIHFIIVMIRWTGLAPWEFEFPFPGSLTSTFLANSGTLLLLRCSSNHTPDPNP